MEALIEVNYAENTANARDVYDYIFKESKTKTAFNVWITRAINKYGFIEGKDFQSFLIESTGGRPKKDYAVTIDMAKELCMVSPTEIGKRARKYFLQCEKIAKEIYAKQQIAKETRKELTDSLKDSGEAERMHGHAYSNYTRFIYHVVGVLDDYKEYKKQYPKGKDFRKTLPVEKLNLVRNAEMMVKPLLEIGSQYGEIKETLEPIFMKIKEIK